MWLSAENKKMFLALYVDYCNPTATNSIDADVHIKAFQVLHKKLGG